MNAQFQVRITKDIIFESKNCGIDNDLHKVGTNCAIAIALQDIFPEVYVSDFHIFPFGIDNNEATDLKIDLPLVAQQFVQLFDGFRLVPKLRLLLPEFEFMVDLPEDIINAINIEEIQEYINDNKEPGISYRLVYNVVS